MLCVLSLAAAAAYAALETAAAHAGTAPQSTSTRKKIRLSDVKQFRITYWLGAVCIALFYSVIFPFQGSQLRPQLLSAPPLTSLCCCS